MRTAPFVLAGFPVSVLMRPVFAPLRTMGGRTAVSGFFVANFYFFLPFFFRRFAFFFSFFFRFVFERFFEGERVRFRFGGGAVRRAGGQQQAGEEQQDEEQSESVGHGRIHRLTMAPPLAKSV
jgi:hypothetical protein